MVQFWQHNTPSRSFSHPWTQETRSNEFWVFSKKTHHSSLIPRSSQLFKMAVASNFPTQGIVVDVKIPTHVGFTKSNSPGLPDPLILGQTIDRCITFRGSPAGRSWYKRMQLLASHDSNPGAVLLQAKYQARCKEFNLRGENLVIQICWETILIYV